MSMTDRTPGTATEVRGTTTDTFAEPRRRRETRLFAKTSEFWATLIGIVAVAAIYNAAADTSLDLWRASLLGTMIGIAYIVSRGIAKAGSQHHDMDHGRNYDR